MTDFPRVEIARITDDQILIYDRPINPLPRTDRQRISEEHLTRGLFNGFMSTKTKSQVKKYLATWINAVQELRQNKKYETIEKIPYLTFVTLTLPAQQFHTDNEIKRLALTPFIQNLKRKHDIRNYYWRAEPQQNGNIHFHIICDSFVDWKVLRCDWNTTLDRLGYIDKFEMAYNHRNPNSTDIHKFKSIKNPAAYVIKYMTKTDGYRKIEGRIHGCSDSIRDLKPYSVEIDNEVSNMIIEATKQPEAYIHKDDQFVVIKCNVRKLLKTQFPEILQDIREYHLSISKQLYEKSKPLEPEIIEPVLAVCRPQLYFPF